MNALVVLTERRAVTEESSSSCPRSKELRKLAKGLVRQ
jgi:hypothetical protein